MTVERRVITSAPDGEVFASVSDFAPNDRGGSGGREHRVRPGRYGRRGHRAPGTGHRTVSRLRGRTTELGYIVSDVPLSAPALCKLGDDARDGLGRTLGCLG